MRRAIAIVTLLFITGWSGAVEARERQLEQLPKDVWDLAFVWTEPVKGIAEGTRRFDPVSGIWFGLLEGSMKSVERVTDFLLPQQKDASPSSAPESQKPLLRYSF